MGLMWYVARTAPRAEFTAASELTRDGYEVFLPSINDPNPRSVRSKIPLFPGYIFISHDSETEIWPEFRDLHRIAGWVKVGGEIPSLPDSDVVELMDRLDVIERQGGILHNFSAGDKVRVDTGIIQCLAEVVEGFRSPQARAKVLLQFMGRRVFAKVPWETLEPMDSSSADKPRPRRRTRGGGRWINNARASTLAPG